MTEGRNPIHDETQAAADEMLAAVLAKRRPKAPDVVPITEPVVAVKTADAAAAPTPPAMPDAGVPDVSMGRPATGRRRVRAATKSATTPPPTDSSKGVESDPYATVVLENGQVWEGMDSQGRTVRCRVSDVHGEHLTENSSTFDSAGRMVEGRAGGRRRDEFIKELRSGKFRLLDAAASASPEAGKVELPQEGETYRYSDPLNGVMLVTRKNGKYEVTNERGISFQIFADGLTEAEIRTQLGVATFLGKETGVARVTPEPAPAPASVTPDRRMDAALGVALAGGAAAAAAATVEAPKGPEGAPARPEAGPALPGRTLDQVQDEIDRVSELTNVARKDYVRIEAEQKLSMEKVKRVFRNLFGGKEVNDEVRSAREDYEQKLLALKELELEKVKLSGLRGEALREHLVAVIVEYNFNEAERFDDDRRELRLKKENEPLLARIKHAWHETRQFDDQSGMVTREIKDAWKLSKEGARVFCTATYRFAKAFGRGYAKLTDTQPKKWAMAAAGLAGAGALTFATGGAAAAIGGVLFLKRLGAGTAGAVGVKAGLDAYTRGRRERAAREEADAVASQVMGASLGDVNKARAQETNLEKIRNQPPIDYKNIEISPAGLQHIEKYLTEQMNWRKQAAKRELWRQSRLYGAVMFGAGIANLGHWRDTLEWLGDKLGIVSDATDEQVREVARRGAAAASGAVRGVAEAASAPGGAASAAQAAAETVNAPAAAASAADSVTSPAAPASAAEGGVIQAPNTPATPPSGAPEAPDDGGEPATRTETPGSAGAEQPAASGRPEAIRMLTDTWEIKPGATIGRLAVMAAQEAGIEDPAAQRRFARLLVEHINTRLAAATGDVAEAAGFIPHPDGSYTADLIPANSELNLTQIGVTPSDIENLLTQAETGVTPLAAPLAEAVVAGGGETAVTATEGSSTEVPTAPGATAVAEASAPTTSPATPAEVATGSVRAEGMGETSVRSEITGRTDADYTADETIRRRIATLEYIKSLDKTEQVQLYSSSKSLVKQLLSTAEVMGDNTDARYDPTSRKLGGAWVARILGDYAGLKESSSYVIDTTINPLHRSQMEGVRAFALAVEEAFGKEFARPAPRESVQEYVLRSMALAKAKGITLPGMVN